jgi:hypothetical protein
MSDDPLPDSFAAFINGGSDGARRYDVAPDPADIMDMQTVSVEPTGLGEGTLLPLGEVRDILQGLPEQQNGQVAREFAGQNLLEFRNPDEIVLEYTTIFTLAQRELWDGPRGGREEGWRDVIALIGYAAREDTPDIDIYVPEDTRHFLDFNDVNGGNIDPVVDELEAVTEPLQVPVWKDGEPHLSLASSVRRLDDPVIGAYCHAYVTDSQDGGVADVAGAPAATPATVLEALRLNDGDWDYPPLNRLDSMPELLDWVPDEREQAAVPIPAPYQEADPADYTDIDALVLDHCTVMDMLVERERPGTEEDAVYDGEEVLELFNIALNYSVDEEQLSIYILDNQEDYLTPIMHDDHAAAVVDDLAEMTGTVTIDDDIAVPDRYMEMDEDYRIVESANEQIDGNPLFVTADYHFSQFDCDALHAGKAVEAVRQTYGGA